MPYKTLLIGLTLLLFTVPWPTDSAASGGEKEGRDVSTRETRSLGEWDAHQRITENYRLGDGPPKIDFDLPQTKSYETMPLKEFDPYDMKGLQETGRWDFQQESSVRYEDAPSDDGGVMTRVREIVGRHCDYDEEAEAAACKVTDNFGVYGQPPYPGSDKGWSAGAFIRIGQPPGSFWKKKADPYVPTVTRKLKSKSSSTHNCVNSGPPPPQRRH